jgi:hypothetical protein
MTGLAPITRRVLIARLREFGDVSFLLVLAPKAAN